MLPTSRSAPPPSPHTPTRLPIRFPNALVRIHDLVRATGSVDNRAIGIWVEQRNSKRDVNLLPLVRRRCGRLFLGSFKPISQLDPVFVVVVLQQDGKLVTADPENRTVLEDAANQLAGGLQVRVALVRSDR